jgi:catechol 2,3-dioxygenase-like lactoylglutathione lyase family enzyme
MTLRWTAVVMDCTDAPRVGEFWAAVLGVPLQGPEQDSSGDVVYWLEPGGEVPDILFVNVPEPKTVKNRVHLDLRPDDQDAEVRRLESLGARRVDIGQGDVTWVVLADPEGNELCVLRPRPDPPRSDA